MHVSALPVFANLNLSKEQLILVHKNLHDLSYFVDVKVTVFSTDFVINKMNGIFAKSLNEHTYFTLMNDLLCFFEFDNTKSIFRQTDEASNYKNNSPRLIFLGSKQTEVFTNAIALLVANQ